MSHNDECVSLPISACRPNAAASVHPATCRCEHVRAANPSPSGNPNVVTPAARARAMPAATLAGGALMYITYNAVIRNNNIGRKQHKRSVMVVGAGERRHGRGYSAPSQYGILNSGNDDPSTCYR